MKIHILTIGRLKDGPLRQIAADYTDRILKAGPQIGLKSLTIREFDEAKAATPDQRKTREADTLRAALPAGAMVVALDETGKSLKSRDFSSRIAAWRDGGEQDLVFLIGGPDGLDRDLVNSTRLAFAFGRATWPHQLVRVMLLEQIYRATTLMRGHPYHRD